MNRDRVRQVTVLLAIVIGTASGLVGDYGTDPFSPIFTPATYAFVIWAPIYLGSLGYAVHQAKPSQATNPLLRRVGYPSAAAYLLTGTWIRAEGRPWLVIVLIAATMAAAALTYSRLGRQRSGIAGTEKWLVRAPIGLHTGWITLATLVATTQALNQLGVTISGTAETRAAVVLLAVGAIIGGAVSGWVPASPAYAAALAWGLTGTAVEAAPDHLPVAVTAVAAVVVISVVAWRRARPPVPGSGVPPV